MTAKIRGVILRVKDQFMTLLIVAYLLTALVIFYASSLFGVEVIARNYLLLAIAVDGLYLFLHLLRSRVRHTGPVSFDPSKLSIIISCYNGEDVLPETIRQCLVHVPANQIIVVSDASSDNTAEVARSMGVRVVVNTTNINKAFSVSKVAPMVTTPYVLVLDDDTLIGRTFIPTSLMDEGYSAVAFNVMPVPTGTLLNKLQLFEYRKSMTMSKSLRGNIGAIGNVSGAIGMFRTSDLVAQARLHSGQFGGEDQQRTIFVHLVGSGKGVTYFDSLVETHAPNSLKALIKQRSMRWNLSLPELFVVYLRVIFRSDKHYLLKTEKAYQIYLFLTDPVRMLFFWTLLVYPLRLFQLFWFYQILSFVTWFKIGRKDPLWVPAIYPLYSFIENFCRFFALFYWFKIKYDYLFKHRFHKVVTKRPLIAEYLVVLLMVIPLWTYTSSESYENAKEVTFSELVSWGVLSPRGETLDYLSEEPVAADDDQDQPVEPEVEPETVEEDVPVADEPPVLPDQFEIVVEEGDGRTSVAQKAVLEYVEIAGIELSDRQLLVAADYLQERLPEIRRFPGDKELVGTSLIIEAVDYSLAVVTVDETAPLESEPSQV